jgi:hypothetical protein
MSVIDTEVDLSNVVARANSTLRNTLLNVDPFAARSR